MTSTRDQALAEMTFCEAILAKGGLNVLSETFAGVDAIAAWDHYPPGDVFDPVSKSQWFYHCHPAEDDSREHGHFHCFVRPEGADGPIHHLVAIGVDAQGRLLRLFTVNQWVVGDDWVGAKELAALLEKFDVQMPKPSYLVNRWLTSIIVAYEDEIRSLIEQRDVVLTGQGESLDCALADHSIEVTSELVIEN
ncbi:DUF6969 family protein [Devosia chinhatensis]|uniref:DUF6969 domain-containing protein n=1 Tax=Devosia chinhatensis TaxID=429727 RepID=A0A0F5FMG2_9HYPH|nr:hypothetical protein [Devosia chinhatensis]KKB10021.1 hypothetical protein VE26_09520 [Devosia chinhatensis]